MQRPWTAYRLPLPTVQDTIQLETAVTTISQEYLLEFTSEYGISEALHPELPYPEDRIVDFRKGKARPRREGVLDYCGLAYKCSKGWDASREYVFPQGCDDTEHTSYPNSKTTRSTTLLSRVELQILPGRRDMDLFSLIRAPNLTKVKTGSRPRATHEVPSLTVTANRVIEMEDPAIATDSSGVLSTIERSPLDFSNENPSQLSTGPDDQEAAAPEVPLLENVTTTGVAPEAGQAEGVAATGPHVVKEHCKRGHDRVDINAPPKVLRRDHADPRPTKSTCGGKSLAAIELGMGSTRPVSTSQGAPVGVSDSDPLSFADPQSRPPVDVTQSSNIYRPGWGIMNGCLLDAPEACQDLVDHIALPEYFFELCHLHNDDFLKQYNVNLAEQVAMGSQLRLRFNQEAKLLKKSVAQVARRDKRIQSRENKIKNLETLLEAETDMKKATENRSAELSKELESMQALFSDLQYEDNWVEQHCAEIDARLDALSLDFDEELYLHMLTAITGRRWVIEHGLRLAVMKCDESTELRQAFTDVVSAGIAKGISEGLKHGVKHKKADLNLEAIKAYDPKAEAKYLTSLHAIKDLKYPIVDQLENLKDAPIDVIMKSLHLNSDTEDDAP
nr:hypothetical protein [Tanacetum cinerariifolium]